MSGAEPAGGREPGGRPPSPPAGPPGGPERQDTRPLPVSGPSGEPDDGGAAEGWFTVPDPAPEGVDPYPVAHAEPDPTPPPASVRRFWSARRVLSGVVALLGLAAAGLVLYDVAAVRSGRRAMQWRRTLAHELATRPLDDTWVLAGSAVAAAVGLWLLVLAVTPGRRRVLPQRPPSGTMRCGLDRRTAAGLLRDSAVQVAGVGRADVRVRRRRASVRADVRFRDVAEVREELSDALSDRIDRMALARRPKLALKLRPVRG